VIRGRRGVGIEVRGLVRSCVLCSTFLINTVDYCIQYQRTVNCQVKSSQVTRTRSRSRFSLLGSGSGSGSGSGTVQQANALVCWYDTLM
jgi:hypothetical protein